MPLRIYNSLTRKKEVFKPVEKNRVKMYVCGMTVYSDAHIGHARTYLAFDLIRRYLEYKKFDVMYIQNITDVDDKIILAAQKQGLNALDYSDRFTERCLEDLDQLGIRRATVYPKASETIPDMITMIQQIIDNRFGYVSEGDVYFSVDKSSDYGKLSGQNREEMKSGARIQPEDIKKDPLDFALWKSAKPGEPSWDSPWGKGRPGWHIECSAMSSKYLGLPFDIHGGGMDLRFPHHENEIAQAEAATKKKFVNYWMHIGLLTINGEKMSKSLGNIINIRDILQQWDAEVIRMFFAQAHYRSPPDFSEKALIDTKKGLDRIYRLKERLETVLKQKNNEIFDISICNKSEKQYIAIIDKFTKEFEAAMDDDFNTPKAFATIFEFINASNKILENSFIENTAIYAYALNQLQTLGKILTLFQEKKDHIDISSTNKIQQLLEKYHISTQSDNIDTNIKKLLEMRKKSREQKNWKIADEIRSDLEDMGFEIQDTENGTIWRKR
ncbi:MAG: cysteine--tRNA ligase [Thermoplasmatota archaeon]